MGLITTPAVLNDGTTDRTFNWLYQVPGTLAALYEETAATAYAESVLKVAHSTEKSGRSRHLLQSSEIDALVSPGTNDPADDLIAVNVTVVHHPKANPATVEKRLKIALAAAGAAGFTASFMKKLL